MNCSPMDSELARVLTDHVTEFSSEKPSPELGPSTAPASAPKLPLPRRRWLPPGVRPHWRPKPPHLLWSARNRPPAPSPRQCPSLGPRLHGRPATPGNSNSTHHYATLIPLSRVYAPSPRLVRQLSSSDDEPLLVRGRYADDCGFMGRMNKGTAATPYLLCARAGSGVRGT